MVSSDTNHASGGPGFPPTAWTVIRDAQDPDTVEQTRALDRLISVYWRPVYWSLRLDWNASPDGAKDLTQEYFSVFLERSMVDSISEERGRCRFFVKRTLKHFMLDRKRAESRIKRTIDRHIVALEDLPAVERDRPSREARPDHLFEKELMQAILAQSLNDLAKACEKQGRSAQFLLFRTYYLDQANEESLTYDDLADRFEMGKHEVKNRLAELRARFRKIVLGYLRDGVSTDEELAAEIREVFDA